MHTALLFLHLLAAIFTVGPLVHFTTTAARGLRQGDANATAGSARGIRIYALASILVLVFGFGLMSSKEDDGRTTASFTEPWIWISLVLAAAAIALALAVVVPALERAGSLIGRGEPTDALRGRVAGAGGAVALLFLVIVALMVFQPGG